MNYIPIYKLFLLKVICNIIKVITVTIRCYFNPKSKSESRIQFNVILVSLVVHCFKVTWWHIYVHILLANHVTVVALLCTTYRIIKARRGC